MSIKIWVQSRCQEIWNILSLLLSFARSLPRTKQVPSLLSFRPLVLDMEGIILNDDSRTLSTYAAGTKNKHNRNIKCKSPLHRNRKQSKIE
ncbi:hypothetical protein B0H66DRAFT_301542 [Apodospora peruviana]|uniref:Uncharacterized protein n=1 Tax=Apodospora peruviana TaxID=516989 RepID=A0AAE0M2A6_9PEZI|nr:hypothetical protein B0H66DRAFT_301542 [Apodospora peruviana]